MAERDGDALVELHPPWWSGEASGRNVVHRPDLLGRVAAPCRPVEQVRPDDLAALPQRS
ncbi:hypothetical protein [Pseudonocardia sp. NPDC049154]|uniref:hypothetical protein n=1 Tax=Pseudonocardia sp. NPDC049154 TaxID=3155501 RepID=UPI0033DB5662